MDRQLKYKVEWDKYHKRHQNACRWLVLEKRLDLGRLNILFVKRYFSSILKNMIGYNSKPEWEEAISGDWHT